MMIHVLTENGFELTNDLDKIITYLVAERNDSKTGEYRDKIDRMLYKAYLTKFKDES